MVVCGGIPMKGADTIPTQGRSGGAELPMIETDMPAEIGTTTLRAAAGFMRAAR
jgi:hypothetical protein